MKKSNKFFIVVVVLILSLSFIACGGSDGDSTLPSGGFNGVVSGTVENASAYSDIKRIAVFFDEEEDEEEITICNFTNGNFTLNLPPTIPSGRLWPVETFLLGAETTNNSAKMNFFEFIHGFDSTTGDIDFDDFVAMFVYGKETSNSFTSIEFTYSDSDVVITGSGTMDFGMQVKMSYKMSLEKGWNKVYCTMKASSPLVVSLTWSTKPVSGLKWFEEDDDDWKGLLFKSNSDFTPNTQIGEENFDIRKIKNKFRGLK